MAYQSLVDLPFFQSRSSQLSCLGSGTLVGDSKELKCGAGSSLSTSSGSREGDRGDPDFRFRSLLYGGRFLSYQECVGEAREDGLDREAMLMPLLYR